jgi:hypothetical protein
MLSCRHKDIKAIKLHTTTKSAHRKEASKGTRKTKHRTTALRKCLSNYTENNTENKELIQKMTKKKESNSA